MTCFGLYWSDYCPTLQKLLAFIIWFLNVGEIRARKKRALEAAAAAGGGSGGAGGGGGGGSKASKPRRARTAFTYEQVIA